MRVLIRKSLDTDKPINLRTLSPLDKIQAGIMTKLKSTQIYKRNKQRKDEAAYLEQLQRDEDLKGFLLAILYRELNQNSSLSTKNKVCDSIIVSVNQHYEDSLKRLFPELYGIDGESSKDFLSYDIERVVENSDIRRAFKEMPILLKCSKKHL